MLFVFVCPSIAGVRMYLRESENHTHRLTSLSWQKKVNGQHFVLVIIGRICGVFSFKCVCVTHCWFPLEWWWLSPFEPPMGSYWLSFQLPIYTRPFKHSSREVLATAGEVLIENNLKADGWIALPEHPYTPLMSASAREANTHASEMIKVLLTNEFACLCHLFSLQVRWKSGEISGHGGLLVWKRI